MISKGGIGLLKQINQQLYEIDHTEVFGVDGFAAVLESLKVNSDGVMLFQYLAANDRGGTADDLQFLLEAFADGYLGFKQFSTQKETEENIKKLLSKSMPVEEYGGLESLYQSFLDDPEILDAELLDTVKYQIYNAVVSELVQFAPNVVTENIVFKNSFCIQITENSWFLEDKALTNWWYVSNGMKETKQALKEDPFLKGVILSNRYDFFSFICAFECYETEQDYGLRIFIHSKDQNAKEIIRRLGKMVN